VVISLSTRVPERIVRHSEVGQKRASRRSESLSHSSSKPTSEKRHVSLAENHRCDPGVRFRITSGLPVNRERLHKIARHLDRRACRRRVGTPAFRPMHADTLDGHYAILSMARMSRFSRTRLRRCSPAPRTTTSTMASAKSSARITWFGNSTRNTGYIVRSTR